MRDGFIKKLHALAKQDERIVLLTGDLGYSVIEEFQKDFPNRFYNTGIAEQNMIGIATGLANSGFIPFCYSIAPFALLRPFEFIKNGPVAHNLKVRIIGVGGGFEYGELGGTHYCLEDIALSRVFPNLRSMFPINNANAQDILQQSYDLNGPIYYRIGKNKTSLTDNIILDCDSSGIEKIYENKNNKIAVIAISSIVEQAKKALDINNNFNLYALTNINPLPKEVLASILSNHEKIITIESHHINGGLGTIISEIITEFRLDCILHKLAIKNQLLPVIGNALFLEEKYQIDSDTILKFIANNVWESFQL